MIEPPPRRSVVKVLLAIVVLAGAVTVAATRVDLLQGGVPSQGKRTDALAAPEFTGIATWINSEPLTLASLRGKVVLVDFWTYSCINCVRTLPGNRRIYSTYHPYGLEVIGVHSPEFGFEKVTSNVRSAVERLRVTWPVAMDSDMDTWRAYRNAYWPRVYLLDAMGRIRFDYAGEGHHADIEASVRTLLEEAGRRDLPEPIGFDEGRFNARITPEIYAGYQRGSQSGSLGNDEGFRPDGTVRYAAPSSAQIAKAGTDGRFFLEGAWHNNAEFLEATEDGARVILPFYARDVFFVAAPAGNRASARIEIDGLPGEPATIEVARSDLFTAVGMADVGTHTLTFEVSKGFRLFTFTFG